VSGETKHGLPLFNDKTAGARSLDGKSTGKKRGEAAPEYERGTNPSDLKPECEEEAQRMRVARRNGNVQGQTQALGGGSTTGEKSNVKSTKYVASGIGGLFEDEVAAGEGRESFACEESENLGEEREIKGQEQKSTQTARSQSRRTNALGSRSPRTTRRRKISEKIGYYRRIKL